MARSNAKLLTLYGMSGSLYTAKVRAYLRQQGIDFIERPAGHPNFIEKIVPQIGRWIIPVIELADGTILQDGTAILDHFEASDLKRESIMPEDPVLSVIAHLFELFGGEGLLRPAMHYRWNFDEDNLGFIKSVFREVLPFGLEEEQADAMFAMSSGRMRKAAIMFGVTPETQGTIEASYTDFLTRLDRHFSEYPFLLGGKACLGDFGLLNPLYPHLGRDPTPAFLMKRMAPNVCLWIERMHAHEAVEDELALRAKDKWLAASNIPISLKALMAFVAEEYLPELTAHIDYANAWLAEHPALEAGTNGLERPGDRSIGFATFEWRGHEVKTAVMPYRFWLLQRLQSVFEESSEEARTEIRALLAETALEAILELKTDRPVLRENHLEVWGEPHPKV